MVLENAATKTPPSRRCCMMRSKIRADNRLWTGFARVRRKSCPRRRRVYDADGEPKPLALRSNNIFRRFAQSTEALLVPSATNHNCAPCARPAPDGAAVGSASKAGNAPWYYRNCLRSSQAAYASLYEDSPHVRALNEVAESGDMPRLLDLVLSSSAPPASCTMPLAAAERPGDGALEILVHLASHPELANSAQSCSRGRAGIGRTAAPRTSRRLASSSSARHGRKLVLARCCGTGDCRTLVTQFAEGRARADPGIIFAAIDRRSQPLLVASEAIDLPCLPARDRRSLREIERSSMLKPSAARYSRSTPTKLPPTSTCLRVDGGFHRREDELAELLPGQERPGATVLTKS